MNSTAYMRIGRVCFQDDNTTSGFNYVDEFEDDYDQIVIRSDVQIDTVYRGWLGNITYWMADGVDASDATKTNLTSEPHCVRDALCVRVNVTHDIARVIRWEYVFLKF